jgi:hypothetical protein
VFGLGKKKDIIKYRSNLRLFHSRNPANGKALARVLGRISAVGFPLFEMKAKKQVLTLIF